MSIKKILFRCMTRCLLFLSLVNGLFAAGARGSVLEINTVRIETPPKLDGKLDDYAWVESATYGSKISGFVNVTGTLAMIHSPIIYLAYDDTNLYLGATVFVIDVKNIQVKSTDQLFDWTDDLIQIFLEPELNKKFVSFGINCLGKANNSSIKAAGLIGNNYWVCEMAIPWAIININPQKTRLLGINICANQLASAEGWIAWNPTYGAFANANRFGYLVLGNKMVSKNVFKTSVDDSYTVLPVIGGPVSDKTSIIINFNNSIGAIKPLHGVNNGPVSYGSFLDMSKFFKSLGIPFARLHDPNWPHPREVDIPQIFPDENADPEDPANYDFRRTDIYLKSILDTGAQIVYRLGTSIEHTKVKYFIHPPKNFTNWAKVCIGIIKHYNHGWANGFHYGIKYWEIWNEPDGSGSWSGSSKDYSELYAVAAQAIKKFDHDVKIGGCAITHPIHGREFVNQFLTLCRDRQLPLDFFSWHTYTMDPRELAENGQGVRKMLDEYGFRGTESHLNEWNLLWGDCLSLGEGKELARREAFSRYKNEIGASFAAAALIMLQDAAVDVANYYDSQPTSWFCGLFDTYGVPQKTYYAFQAFREILNYPVRVSAEITSIREDTSCLATVNKEKSKAAILISKFGGEKTAEYSLEFSNFSVKDSTKCEIYILDKYNNLDLKKTEILATGTKKIKIVLQEYSVALIKLN